MPNLRGLLDPDPSWDYGSVLPLAKRKDTGELSMAMPGIVRGPIQGLLGLYDEFGNAVEGQGFDPQRVTEGALALPVGGALADTAAKPLAKAVVAAANKGKTQAGVSAGLLAEKAPQRLSQAAFQKARMDRWKAIDEMVEKTIGPHPRSNPGETFNQHRERLLAWDKAKEAIGSNFPDIKREDYMIDVKPRGPRVARPEPELTGLLAAGRAKAGGNTGQELLKKAWEADPERMQRAKDMGFDTENLWFHGSPYADELEKFNNEMLGTNHYLESDSIAHFFGSHPEIANRYTNFHEDEDVPEGVFPTLLRGKPLIRNRVPQQDEEIRRGIAATQKAGKDVFVTRDDMGSKAHVAAVADPKNIRSIFAQFRDPESTDLLAANKGKLQSWLSAGLLGREQSHPLKPSVLTEQMARMWKADPERMARAEQMGFDTSRAVYHGTEKDFRSFDPTRYKNKYKHMKAPEASFFTDATDVADRYAGKTWGDTWAYPGAQKAMTKHIDENYGGAATEYKRIKKIVDDYRDDFFNNPANKGQMLLQDPEFRNMRKALMDYEDKTGIIDIMDEVKSKFMVPEHSEGSHIMPMLLNKGKTSTVEYDDMELEDMVKDVAKIKKAGFDSATLIDPTHSEQSVIFDPKRIRSIFAQFRDPESTDILAANKSPIAGLLADLYLGKKDR